MLQKFALQSRTLLFIKEPANGQFIKSSRIILHIIGLCQVGLVGIGKGYSVIANLYKKSGHIINCPITIIYAIGHCMLFSLV